MYKVYVYIYIYTFIPQFYGDFPSPLVQSPSSLCHLWKLWSLARIQLLASWGPRGSLETFKGGTPNHGKSPKWLVDFMENPIRMMTRR